MYDGIVRSTELSNFFPKDPTNHPGMPPEVPGMEVYLKRESFKKCYSFLYPSARGGVPWGPAAIYAARSINSKNILSHQKS